jgi:hypothetical protein
MPHQKCFEVGQLSGQLLLLALNDVPRASECLNLTPTGQSQKQQQQERERTSDKWYSCWDCPYTACLYWGESVHRRIREGLRFQQQQRRPTGAHVGELFSAWTWPAAGSEEVIRGCSYMTCCCLQGCCNPLPALPSPVAAKMLLHRCCSCTARHVQGSQRLLSKQRAYAACCAACAGA